MVTSINMMLRVLQSYQDKIIVYPKSRWGAFLASIFIYGIRIFSIQGYYVVTYALAIFLLNLFLRFLTPIKADLEDDDSDEPVLPIRERDEYKPIIRKLGEYKFWKTSFIATLIGYACTFITALDFPVFWPVLVMYFVILFVVTMRRQISHMIKHRYIPFDIGKAKYNKNNN
jgi:Rer1 family